MVGVAEVAGGGAVVTVMKGSMHWPFPIKDIQQTAPKKPVMRRRGKINEEPYMKVG